MGPVQTSEGKLHLVHPSGKKIAPHSQRLEDYNCFLFEALCISFGILSGEKLVTFQEHKNPSQRPAFGGNGVSAIGLRAWCWTTYPGSGSKW